METKILSLAATVAAADLREYTVYRASSPISVDGKLDEPAWRDAPTAGDFTALQAQNEGLEQTIARLLWDDENLYVSFFCHDRHISAYVTERHGPVSRDDCVEIFVSPNPGKVRNYYTFEINAIGTMLNQCRTDWQPGNLSWEPTGVRHRTCHHGILKKSEDPADERWVVEMAIPFQNFTRDAARIPPRQGDVWRLNLNRTGGITNKRASTWSPIPAGVRAGAAPRPR